MKKRPFLQTLLFLCLLCGVIFVRPVAAQTNDKYAASLRAFETDVHRFMQKNKIPGLTIGFVKNDYVWVKGFGYGDVENKIPATADSAYRLASVQKTMTAVAILQLGEQGKVNLDADVRTYVPYFPQKTYPVTVRQLLGHLGGIRHYYKSEEHFTTHKTTKQSIAIFAGSPLVVPPGTKFSFSSYGYDLLGAVIEGASHQSYADYMRTHIWEPLGMDNTHMDDRRVFIPNRVRGYQLINGQVKPSELIDVSSRFGSAGTRASVVDLLKFMNGLNEGKLLSRPSMDLLITPMKTQSGSISGLSPNAGYGMGWEVSRIKNTRAAFHTGGQQETRTFVVNVPDEHLSIAFAMNLEDGKSDGPLVYELFEIITHEKWSRSSP